MRHLKLGQVANFINGLAFAPEDWGEQGTQIIRIQNLTDATKPYNRTKRDVHSKYAVCPGDLLVSWSASLGVFEWAGPEAALVNQHIFRVIPDEELVDKRYLRYALELALTKMARHLHGSTMQHVNRAEFLETRLAFPELDEQRRIAAIMDQADDLRRKRRFALEKLNKLLRAIFVHSFLLTRHDWPSSRLKDIAERVDYGHTASAALEPVGPHLLRITDIQFGRVDWDTVPYCEATPLQESRATLRTGDIVFARTGATTGKSFRIDNCPERTVFASYLIRVRPNDRILSEYLEGFCQTTNYWEQISRSARGVAQPGVNASVLGELVLPLPPIDLQASYVRDAREVKRLMRSNDRHLSKLDQLFSSLQSRLIA